MNALGGRELLVHMRELAARVAEEQPARDHVVKGTQVHEDEQGPGSDHEAVTAEQQRFVRREKRQLTGEPAGQEKGRQRGEKGGVLNHRDGSSNA